MRFSEYFAKKKELGETQKSFAEEIGVNQPYLNKIIKKKMIPKPELMEQIRIKTKGMVSFDDWLGDIKDSWIQDLKKENIA